MREGTDPTQAACAPYDWPGAEPRALPDPLPDCITLMAEQLFTDDGPFGGWLPVDSGTWTVLAQVAGDPGAPLRSRPTGFRPLEVTPVGDDIATTIVGERRPGLSLVVGERSDEMELGSSQTVEVTVTAEGGEAGFLEGLTFTPPSILAPVDPDAAILELADPDAGSIEPFTLLPGESRTFPVEVHAIGLGDGEVRVGVSGRDDLGSPLAVEQGGILSVVLTEAPGAVPAPVIEHARDIGDGADDTIDGTVEGDPETTVTVSLATALEDGRGEACVGRMTGDGVQSLGSFPVTIGTDGVGRFSRISALTPGWVVVGVTVVGPQVSAVSACTPVTVASRTISIDDVDVTEGEPATFSLSLSAPSESVVRVRVQTADGSATSPADYARLTDQEVTVEPGAWTATLEIPVKRDKKAEEPETFRVLLTDPVGGFVTDVDGSGTDPEGVATIVDGGAATEAIDVRGTWTVTLAGQPARYELVIKTQDPESGAITGTLDVGQRVPVTGTVRGGRLELKMALGGRSSRGSGELKRKNGRLTATIPLRDDQGAVGTLKLTLTDPRG